MRSASLADYLIPMAVEGELLRMAEYLASECTEPDKALQQALIGLTKIKRERDNLILHDFTHYSRLGR